MLYCTCTLLHVHSNTCVHSNIPFLHCIPTRQLLNECGIGVDESCDSDHASSVGGAGLTGGAVVSQHRVLLFCQYKSILDIIEKDLFK